MKISEIITDKYKLRIEPTVYYDILADVREAEEEQEHCEDAISRREAISIASIATLSVNQVVTALEKLPSVNPQKPICPSAGIDCEDCPVYEPKILNKWIGAEVLDRIRNEMHATAEKHEDGVYYLRDEWIDEIIDKYAEEDKV